MYEAFFDTALDGLLIVNLEDATLVRANPHFHKMTGYSENDLAGKSLLEHFHPEDAQVATEELEKLAKGKVVYEFTGRYITASKDILFMSWSATVDRQRQLIYAVARDITSKIRQEAQLKAVAYVASHDFSEPIRAITQFSSLLLEKEGHKLSERGHRWLQKNILESSNRLRTLSEDLRDYLKSMRAEPILEPIRLNEATQAAIELLNGTVEEKSATIDCASLGTVWATKQLQQVLYNLLSNAIKYTADGVKPSVHVTSECDKDTCTLHVRDNGIGFDPKYADSIFDLGRRLFASDSKYWGSGIGLAIVKLHVERMGGQVWASSTPGSGSCFSVRLRKV
jgi:PAS domain S-box-containing protein